MIGHPRLLTSHAQCDCQELDHKVETLCIIRGSDGQHPFLWPLVGHHRWWFHVRSLWSQDADPCDLLWHVCVSDLVDAIPRYADAHFM